MKLYFLEIYFFRIARIFEIDGTITRKHRRFNAARKQITVCLLPPSPNVDPANHFLACVNDLLERVLQNVSDSDMVVGMTIHNQVNQSESQL